MPEDRDIREVKRSSLGALLNWAFGEEPQSNVEADKVVSDQDLEESDGRTQ